MKKTEEIEELKSLENMAEWISRHFMPTVDLDVDPPIVYQIDYDKAKKNLIEYALPRIIKSELSKKMNLIHLTKKDK